MIVAVEDYIGEMPADMAELMPDLLPKTMDSLMPTYLPQLIPHLTPKFIDYVATTPEPTRAANNRGGGPETTGPASRRAETRTCVSSHIVRCRYAEA